MSTIVVEVMPKAELLDPQGKAVAGALSRMGKAHLSGVRVGKRFEITADGPADEALFAEVAELAQTMFSNPVIEDVVSISMMGESTTSVDGPTASGVAGETH